MLHRSSYGKGKTLKHYQLASNAQEIQELFKHHLSHLAPAAGIIKSVNTDTEGTIQSVCINEMSILTL